jgi:hypothetical protein
MVYQVINLTIIYLSYPNTIYFKNAYIEKRGVSKVNFTRHASPYVPLNARLNARLNEFIRAGVHSGMD